LTTKKLNPKAPVAPSTRPWPVNPVELNLSAATAVAPCSGAEIDPYDISAILKEKVRPPQNDVMNGTELYVSSSSLVIRAGALNFKNHGSRGYRC